MKVTLESTEKIVMLKPGALESGVPARIWEGETDSGIKVHCYITRVAIDANETRTEQFEHELQKQKAPSAEIKEIPNYLIL